MSCPFIFIIGTDCVIPSKIIHKRPRQAHTIVILETNANGLVCVSKTICCNWWNTRQLFVDRSLVCLSKNNGALVIWLQAHGNDPWIVEQTACEFQRDQEHPTISIDEIRLVGHKTDIEFKWCKRCWFRKCSSSDCFLNIFGIWKPTWPFMNFGIALEWQVSLNRSDGLHSESAMKTIHREIHQHKHINSLVCHWRFCHLNRLNN